MNLKNFFIIFLCVACAALLFLVLSEPKPIDSHSTELKMVQEDLKIVRLHRDIGLHKIDSLERRIKKADTLLREKDAKIARYDQRLSDTSKLASRLAAEVKALRSNANTLYERKCDSLADAAIAFEGLYREYKAYSESLRDINDQQKIDYGASIDQLRNMYDELYIKYEQLQKLYDALFNDHKTAQKSLRRQRLKTKVAALLGLGVAAGGAIILK